MKIQKLKISSHWTKEERRLVTAAIDSAMAEIDIEIAKTKRLPRYSQVLRTKKAGHQNLKLALQKMSPTFLEDNRSNFSQVIEQPRLAAAHVSIQSIDFTSVCMEAFIFSKIVTIRDRPNAATLEYTANFEEKA